MRKLSALAAAIATFAIAAPAHAETYSSNNLSSGANGVCTMTYGLDTSGSSSRDLAADSCSSLLNASVTCTATLKQGGVTVAGPWSTSSTTSCGIYASYPFAWVAHEGISTIRVALPSGYLWSAQPGFYSGNQDANTWYTCEIGTERRVKRCTFTDRDF